MRLSIFHKHSHCTMLYVLLSLFVNTLSAQKQEAQAVKLPQKSTITPLQERVNPKLDTLITLSEFSGTASTDILPDLSPNTDTLSANIQAVKESENVLIPSVKELDQNSPKTDTIKDNPKIGEKIYENAAFQDSTCIDLAFDSVSIIKMTEKYVEIEYSIVNKGTSPAPIFGSKRSNTDNVAVHFYFSGTPRLTRGSILAEGIYLTEGLRETKGMLEPNAVYKNRFKLSLEKKNRFYGVIILQLDAFDILRHECDETNNIFSIVPKWY